MAFSTFRNLLNTAGVSTEPVVYTGNDVVVIARNVYPYITAYNSSVTPWVLYPTLPDLPTVTQKELAITGDGGTIFITGVTTDDVSKVICRGYTTASDPWAKLTDPSTVPSSYYKSSACTINAAGTLAAVGSALTPYIYGYNVATSPWTKLANPVTLPTANIDSVDMSNDGSLVVAVNKYGVYAYDTTVSPWLYISSIPAITPGAIATRSKVSDDGTMAVVSYFVSPYLTAYDTTQTPWVKLGDPDVLPSGYGFGLGINHAGTRVVYGSNKSSDHIRIYDTTTTPWTYLSALLPTSLPTAVISVNFTPDDSLCLMGCGTGDVLYAYNTTTTPWSKVTVLPTALTGAVYSIDSGAIPDPTAP